MTTLLHRRLMVVVSVSVTLLSGCLDGAGGFAGAPRPQWDVGQWWLYSGDDGLKYLDIVEAIEAKDGVRSYRVRQTLNGSNDAGLSSYPLWFDTKHLSFVATEAESLWVKSSCTSGNFVPLRDEEFQCRTSMTGYSEFNYTIVKRVRGWAEVSMAKGHFPAVQIDVVDPVAGNWTARSLFYMPAAENIYNPNTVTSRSLMLVDWGTEVPPDIEA